MALNTRSTVLSMACVYMAVIAMSIVFSTSDAAEGSLLCFKDENCFNHSCIDKCREWAQAPEQSYCSFVEETQCCCQQADDRSNGGTRRCGSEITIIGGGRGGRGDGRGGGSGRPGHGHGGGGGAHGGGHEVGVLA